MKLALRKTAPASAKLWQRFACWVIKARLVSGYCHGGIVINGALYHATSTGGLHRLDPGEWTPERWDLIETGLDDTRAKLLFDQHKGAFYSWFELMAFAGIPASDGDRFYCFKWCWTAMTGQIPRFRVTPEMLLQLCLLDRTERFCR